MKKYFILGFLFLFSFNATVSAAYQQQGFKTFTENGSAVTFTCTQQCLALLGKISEYDYMTLQGTIKGKGTVGYGFIIDGKIYVGETIDINEQWNDEKKLVFNQFQGYNQLPQETEIVLTVQGNIQATDLNLELMMMSSIDVLQQGISDSLKYVEYNPRTINFLEFPKWNGKYINQAFFWRIVVLLIICSIAYISSTGSKSKKKARAWGVGVIVFFWLLFDLFSTINETKMYKDVMGATNILDTGRVGKNGDFYEFLDYIKQSIPAGEKGYFEAPYPFYFEGKYHAYPHVRVGTLTGSKVVFVYNPYGPQNPFGYIDPVFDATTSKLSGSGWNIDIEKEIVWKPYAKIYLVK